jgi:hypothetical protein
LRPRFAVELGLPEKSTRLGFLVICMERHAPYIGNISAQKLFHSNADSPVNVRIATVAELSTRLA